MVSDHRTLERRDVLFDVLQGLFAGDHTAIAILEYFDARILEFLGDGGATVFNHRDEVAQVAGVANGGFNAFVGVDTNHEERVVPRLFNT